MKRLQIIIQITLLIAFTTSCNSQKSREKKGEEVKVKGLVESNEPTQKNDDKIFKCLKKNYIDFDKILSKMVF